ncbi:MAG: HAD-IC family P-type ATPase [Rhodospirillales bacterium]|nr:HAD-IC family P-type ATPase [Rhodospirillales bacterium]
MMTAAEVADRLGSDLRRGLVEDEVRRRQAAFGPNRLPEEKIRPAWLRLAEQFRSVLILVLIGAAVLAGLVGDLLDMIVILAVVAFNALLGFYQERRAGKILESLRRMLAHQSTVRRAGVVCRLNSDAIVPGDVVLLEAGDRVPADGRLFAHADLQVDESTLTGESLPVDKSAAPLADAEAALADRTNLVFTHTVVTRGRGEMLVTATGATTEIGRLVGVMQAVEESQTPLQRKLDDLGKRLAAIACAVVALIFVMGTLRGEPLASVVLTSIALAVAAIPEGLPAVVTVTLAIGMYQMTRRGAIIKRLAAVEALGSTTVICSDKTGTLTVNQMTARAIAYRGRSFAVSGEGYAAVGRILDDGGPSPDFEPLLLPAALCNDSRITDGRLIGDPTEGALLALAAKGGIAAPEKKWPRIGELPFDSDRKFMATFHDIGEGVLISVKGAPDVLIRMCATALGPDGPECLDTDRAAALHAEVERLGGKALRVLAVASAILPGRRPPDDPAVWMRELTLLGLIGLMDPPRPEASASIAACREAGILVKMITGDHRVTAAAVARELGLEGETIDGHDLDRMDDATLAARIGDIGVIARVAPEHKVRIVRALKARGEVVAMTGDGVNDAAALRVADIGVAMGRTGTDVTREAATMVLTDDNFATIVNAVREGRTIYDNIVKFLRFQLSTNVGALMTVGMAPLLGLPVPFNPIQILWVNIIMDGPPAMALAFDPAPAGIMSKPPRPPDEPILTGRRLGRLLVYGTTMMVGTLGVFAWGLQRWPVEHAVTLAFTTFVMFQFFNVFNARVGTESAFNRNFFSNGKLWLALLGVIGLQVLAVHWSPAQTLFHTVAITALDWGVAVAVASTILVFDETRKLVARLLRWARRSRG